MFGVMDEMTELVAEHQALNAHEAAWLQKVAAFDRSDVWRSEFLSSTAALRTICRMDPGVARHQIVLARKLDQLPIVANAFASGEISARHASVIASACTPKRADAIALVESELVEVAGKVAPRELGSVVRYITDTIDGDGGAAGEKDATDNQTCYLSETLHGYDLRGTFDRPTGLAIFTAINAQMELDHQEDDPRSTPRRRADALGQICVRTLDAGEVGESHGVRPHISVVVDLDELPQLSEERKVEIRNEIRRNGYLSSVTLEWLSCDCDISRVITIGKSEVLDVGRATRTISAALWKALVVRDQHCQHPGCDRIPSYCQAHHVEHWARGGRTRLENLQLLCWQHHRDQHRHDAQARAA
jgi:5-methylcytosine-specific restriction endonuclease McrA